MKTILKIIGYFVLQQIIFMICLKVLELSVIQAFGVFAIAIIIVFISYTIRKD